MKDLLCIDSSGATAKAVVSSLRTEVAKEPAPEVRSAMVDVFHDVGSCQVQALGSESAVAILAVMVRETDPNVLDECARSMKWGKEEGWTFPPSMRETIVRTVQYHAKMVNPNAAWAVFARSPYSFEELGELHQSLVDLPPPDDLAATFYGLRNLSRALSSDALAKPSEPRVVGLLLQFRLYSRALAKRAQNDVKASTKYRLRAQSKDAQCADLPTEQRADCIIQNFKDSQSKESLEQGSRVSVRSSYANDIVDLSKQDGGPSGALGQLVTYTDRTKVPAALVRISAWNAIRLAHTKVDGVAPVVGPETRQALEASAQRETDSKTKGVATQTLAALR